MPVCKLPHILSLALLLWTLATCLAAPAADRFPLPGEWPCYRRDGNQQSRSPLRGHIAEPSVQWKVFTGATRSLVTVEAAPGKSTVALPPEPTAEPPDPGDPRWGLADPLGQIAGREQRWLPDSQVTYADALPEAPGLEKLEFESGFNIPLVNGQWQPAWGRCLAWRNGAWEQVWKVDRIDMLFQALPIAGDFDGDGNPEVALLPWYELLILDARTGQVKDRCRFTEGRSYGSFSVWDLDGDGRSEFVVMSDFAKHVDVLGYRDGKLTLLWKREIELDISNPQKILRAHLRPAADVDGDGRMEVLANTFNDGGDARWRLSIHDGMTGVVKAELLDECLQGVADLDGDGVAELLTVEAHSQGAPVWSTIRVRSLRGGKPTTLWQRTNAAWQTWDRPPPLNVNAAATYGRRDVMCRAGDDGTWAVIREPAGDEVRLSACRWTGARFAAELAAEGPGLEAVGLDPRGALLVRAVTAPDGEQRAVTVRGRVTACATKSVAGQTGVVVAARPAAAGHPTVLAQGYGEELVGMRPPTGDEPARRVFSLAGRAQGTNWPTPVPGPVVGDLRGDGRRQVIFATSAPSGAARLVTQDLDGDEAWHSDFPEIPGSPPVWNTGGLILWQVGHFTSRDSQDVLLTLRRSMMHSEETALLSGVDGKVLWRRNRQISNRGVGGGTFAIADFDGDGLDDAALLHPSVLYILRGSTGEDIIARDTVWDEVPAKPVYWGAPIAGDFLGDGKQSLFFGTASRSMTGLIRNDGSLAWWDALDVSPSALPAFGDLDGDGKLEALAWGYADGVRCYDVASGQAKWHMAQPEPGTPAGVATADTDSDGRDEVVLAVGNKLLCIEAEGDTGRVAWSLDLKTTLGPPALADMDGSGEVAILAQGADGFVYCVR